MIIHLQMTIGGYYGVDLLSNRTNSEIEVVTKYNINEIYNQYNKMYTLTEEQKNYILAKLHFALDHNEYQFEINFKKALHK